MRHKFKTYTFVIICSVFTLFFSIGNASADTITLDSPIWTNIDEGWKTGDALTIGTYARGMMGVGLGYVAFDSPAIFTLSTTSFPDGSYSGKFEVKKESDGLLLLSGNFTDLSVRYKPDTYLRFKAESFFDITGDESLWVGDSGIYLAGNWNISTNQFTGEITSDSLEKPIPNPEPATFFLFGFGLLGVAGIGRRTYIH